jgi:tetratricopeptide (TPR) repeat protein
MAASLLFRRVEMTRQGLVCAVAACLLTAPAGAWVDPWRQLFEDADAQDTAGNYTKALELFRAAVRMAEDSKDPRLPKALSGMAAVEDSLGLYGEADRAFTRALQLAAVGGRHTQAYAAVAVNLAIHYLETGRAAEGEGLLREAVATLSATVPPDDLQLAAARNCQATLLLDQHRFREAETLLNQAMDTFRKHPDPNRAREAIGLNNLGVLQRYKGDFAGAAHFFEESIALVESNMGADHPLLLRAVNNLGIVESFQHHREAARAAFDRALTLAAKRLGTANPTYGKLLLNYAEFEKSAGNKKAGKAMEARAKGILRDNSQANGTGMTIDASAFQPRR